MHDTCGFEFRVYKSQKQAAVEDMGEHDVGDGDSDMLS